MDRQTIIDEIDRRLGRRRLVWMGTRGDDVEAATQIPQLEAALSFISPYRGRSSVESVALEDISGVRVDLDTWDVDDHLRAEAVVQLRDVLLRQLSRPSAIFGYRPTTFLSAAAFSRHEQCLHLGMFRGQQSAFEHKPWVETSVAALGIPRIDWRYIPDDEQLELVGLLADGPVMLRQSRTTGGVGMAKVVSVDELGELWPSEDEGYVSVAPFHPDGIPVNVGAVVWRDGVTLHPASVQLIGIPGATSRPFGFCGNDFGAVAALGGEVLDAVERSALAVADWMRRLGYLGAFGVDFLVVNGEPLFTEVNPRFQGSTHLSCRLSVERDESCLLTEHLAAFLGVPCPPARRLRDYCDGSRPLAHLVVHNLAGDAPIDPAPLLDAAHAFEGLVDTDVTTRPELLTSEGATVARLTVNAPITVDGFSLAPQLQALVDGWATGRC